MYYVVRLAGIKQCEKIYVFPISWMRNSGVQLEKFVANRINRNQIHIFFWSNETNENGSPNDDIQPNFDLPLQTTFPSAINACYYGQPIKFFCNYIDAVAYQNRLRQLAPGLYNTARLTEQPLPNLNQNTDNHDDDNHEPAAEDETHEPAAEDETHEQAHPDSSNGNVESDDEHTTGNELVRPNSDAGNEANNESSVSSSDDVNDGPENSSELIENEPGASTVKTELHLLQRADVNEVDAIINSEGEEVSDDSDGEIEFCVLDGTFPKPVQYSCDGLIKRENDPISENLAYDDVCV